ncbi:MAG: hypothetical protein ACP5IT_09460 [Thermoproteota archaeon]
MGDKSQELVEGSKSISKVPIILFLAQLFTGSLAFMAFCANEEKQCGGRWKRIFATG